MPDALEAVIAEADLEPMPIEPADVLDGAPQAMGKVLFVDTDNGTCSGVWQCTPGSFHWRYDANETVAVISGRASVQCDDGSRVELSAGSYALFRRGARARWTVKQTLRKVFVLH